jgi:hypothetical protein
LPDRFADDIAEELGLEDIWEEAVGGSITYEEVEIRIELYFY